MILALPVLEMYSSGAIGFGIFGRSSIFDNFQPEGVSDIISGMADQNVGVDVCANLVILG